jgi:hypothetical protein
MIDIQHRASLPLDHALLPNKKTKLRAMIYADHNDPTAKVDAAICLHFCFLTHKMPFSRPSFAAGSNQLCVSSACIAMPQISAVPQRRSDAANLFKFMNPSWTM